MKQTSYELFFSQEKEENRNINEFETRKLVDFKLNLSGWIADSVKLKYSKGARPEKNKCLAISEWPTQSGPADYVLFNGLIPIGAIEAKRRNKDVAAKIDQAERYSRDFTILEGMEDISKSRSFKIPFVFSTNGRKFNNNLPTKSGIWFKNLLQKNELSRPIKNFFSPKGLEKLLTKLSADSFKLLSLDHFNYDFDLRYYQKQAIKKIEQAIENNQRSCLLSMATGTGKTKTALAFIYRSFKSNLFNNILYIVDRKFLGEQAFKQFVNTKIENNNSLNDLYELRELGPANLDTEKSNVKITTIQSLLKKVIKGNLNKYFPKIDEYDCIIVDECHRGYILDKELSEVDFIYKNNDEYVSLYRKAIDYFDAFKLGLTATPALHTVEIFGEPIYTYSYRNAVLDNYLVDHLPPIKISTEKSKEGIKWKKSQNVELLNRKTGLISPSILTDKLEFKVDKFNKKVITKNFNKAIAERIVEYIDPYLDGKTLVFCCLDEHADIFTYELKKAYEKKYGTFDESLIQKITGSVDSPSEQIKRFKNERYPNVVTTVDLLTTGVDIEKICNLVFLRKVNSRILFEQMLGRATRLCPEIKKKYFKIFDCVNVFEGISDFIDMKPVVKNPSFNFVDLYNIFNENDDYELQKNVLDRFSSKLKKIDSKKNTLIVDILNKIESNNTSQIKKIFSDKNIFINLDKFNLKNELTPISHHQDKVISAIEDYGNNTNYEDYLIEFVEFIKRNKNKVAALKIASQNPERISRSQLYDIVKFLDENNFSEAKLSSAYNKKTNTEIISNIIGFIRQASIGESLVSHNERVNKALENILSSKTWSETQVIWLKRLAHTLKNDFVSDKSTFDQGAFIDQGGFNRINKLFNNNLENIIDDFKVRIWK